jgi:hypothetical protein
MLSIRVFKKNKYIIKFGDIVITIFILFLNINFICKYVQAFVTSY